RYRWWTFAGGAANSVLAAWLTSFGESTKTTDMWIELDDPKNISRLSEALPGKKYFTELFDRLMIGLKFNETLPRNLAEEVLAGRYLDIDSAQLIRNVSVD